MALRSPEATEDDSEYQLGWDAINHLMRSGVSWSGSEPDTAFINIGDGKFADVSFVANLYSDQDARGAAISDWDGDGDLDMWINFRSGTRVRFMRNQAGVENNFLTLQLVGTSCNRDAIGARVSVETPTRTLVQTVRAGNNFTAQGSKLLHIGLGDETKIESVTVRWPDGTESVHRDVTPGHRYQIVQGQRTAQKVQFPSAEQKLAASDFESPEFTAVASVPLVTPIPIPDFTWDDFNGRTRSLVGDAAGKPVLVNLWASWCLPCISELETFVREQAEWEKSGVDLVALSVDQPEDAAKAIETAKNLGFWFPAGMASEDMLRLLEVLQPVVQERFEDLPLPASVLLDEQGRIARLYLGPVKTSQVAQDARNLPRTDLQRLDYVALGPGGWQVPEYIERNAAWTRLHKLADVLRVHKSYDLALFYASELHRRIAIEQPPERTRTHTRVALTTLAGDLFATRPEDAESLYRWVLELDPENLEALLQLTELLIQKGTKEALAEAAEVYDTALFYITRPETADEFAVFGSTWMRLNRFDQAIPFLREAVKRNENDLNSRANLGLALIATGKDEEGAEILEAIIDKVEPSAANEMTLAAALDRIGAGDRAEVHYTRFIELAGEPASPADHVNLARACERLGDFDSMIAHLHAAWQSAPDDPAMEWQYGSALLHAGESAKALERLEHAIAGREPRSAELTVLGMAYAMNNRNTDAQGAYEKALALEPKNLMALRGLALTLATDKKYEAAVARCEQYLNANPRDPQMIENLGIAYEALGEDAKAAARYREVLDLQPDHAMVTLRLGMLHATSASEEVRDGDEALRLAQQVEEQIGRESPLLLDLYAATYAELGRFDDAVAAAEQAVRRAQAVNFPAEMVKSMQARLEGYRQGKAFHRSESN